MDEATHFFCFLHLKFNGHFYNKMTENADKKDEGVVIHISNLTYNVNEAHLKEIFSGIGSISSVSICRKNGHSLGWGLIHFSSNIDPEQPIKYMNNGYIDGNVVAVRVANLETDIIDENS